MSASQEQQVESSGEDYDDDAVNEGQWPSQVPDDNDEVPLSPTLTSGATVAAQPPHAAHPMQKRRRVTRACDECRRKKIKCDGKQPCTHCTVYSYDCTYDQPSNRRRNPAPQYVESLEIKLQRAEAILQSVLPDVDLDDQRLDHRFPPTGRTSSIKKEGAGNSPASGLAWEAPSVHRAEIDDTETDPMLESMVENTGSLDLDDEGHWDFYGHSSGRAFLRKMRDQFGDLMGKADIYNTDFSSSPSRSRDQSTPSLSSPPAFSVGSPLVQGVPNTNDLPTKACSISFCTNALDDACSILRFVHQPTFYAMLDRVYAMRAEELGPEELTFLPLLYSTLALGVLFATNERSQLINNGFDSAIDQGTHYFRVARSMFDVTDCRDLTSLQTLLMMILFLQSSSRLSTCYAHLGILLRSSIRLGLHRNVQNHFNPVEQEVRKRIFWSLRKLDTYVGALLGLPNMLTDEDIDQEYPLEVDDDYITTEQILPMPPDKPSLMAAFNAHTRVVEILAKTVKYVYPVKGTKSKTSQSYSVSHSRIREIEQDLQRWFESLPIAFRPGMEAPKEFIRIQHLLRMAYAHIEMMVYRPFLHYVSSDIQAKNLDKRSYACAAACVSVSRNIVHLTGEMKRKGLLVGSYWFYMYTTFSAVISLVFFVLENPHSETSAAILRDAHEGRDTLAGLAQRSLAADRCSRQLAVLFEQLPERLEGARISPVSQKRSQPSSSVSASPPMSQPYMLQSAPDVHRIQRPELHPRRAQTTSSCGVWKPPQGVFDQHPQRFNPSFRRASNHPYDPTNLSSTSSAITTPQTPSGPGIPLNNTNTQHGFSDLTSHGVPDLSAIMFPTSDPFAYPNQPMTLLENQSFVKPEDVSDLYSPTTAATPPFQQNFDMQFQLPNYMVPPPHQQQPGTWGLPGMDEDPLTVSGGHTLDGASASATPWPPQHQQHQQPQDQGSSRPPQQRSYDQLFGEDWGGWMNNQGYSGQ